MIDSVLESSDIVKLIGDRVPLSKQGNSHQGLCPFHDEKTPSFSVSPTKQIYHCFGCGASGDAIQFVRDYEGVDFPTALRTLASASGVELPDTQPLSKSTPPTPSNRNATADEYMKSAGGSVMRR